MELIQCYVCGVKAAEMSRCSECKVAHYCSAKCQQDDWIVGPHAMECIGMKSKREETESRAAERLRNAAASRFQFFRSEKVKPTFCFV